APFERMIGTAEANGGGGRGRRPDGERHLVRPHRDRAEPRSVPVRGHVDRVSGRRHGANYMASATRPPPTTPPPLLPPTPPGPCRTAAAPVHAGWSGACAGWA